MNKENPQEMINLMLSNLDIESLETVHCFCGANVWVNGMIVKKVPAIQSPNGQDEILPIPIAFCLKCGRTFEPGNFQESQDEGGDESSSQIVMP